MIRIIATENSDGMSRKAAEMIAAQVTVKPDCVLGLATGSSAEGIYRYLVDWYRAGYLSFARVSTVNLDEYKGLSPENRQSYAYYMNKRLFSQTDIDRERTFLPDGTTADDRTACEAYDRILDRLGGITLQLLGIGRNGHIGFNEPADEIIPDTHCVDLSESTIDANQRFFASREEVPRQAYTMGIGAILRAEKIVLAASGKEKADALARALNGPVTPRIPASFLRLHRDVTVIADREALSLIPGTGY